jgi:hypothetical protein
VRLLRGLFLVFLWLVFVALWYRVYGITTVSDITGAITYLTGITAVYAVLVTAWIFHNLAIYRKKGPRKRVILLDFAAIHDRLGSYIVAPPSIKEKQQINVTVSGGRKVFSESKASTGAL